MIKHQYFWGWDRKTGLNIDLGEYIPDLFDRFILGDADENDWHPVQEFPNIKVSSDGQGKIRIISIARPLNLPFIDLNTDKYDPNPMQEVLERIDKTYTRMDVENLDHAKSIGEDFLSVIFTDFHPRMIFLVKGGS